MPPRIDEAGRRYGRLTVESISGKDRANAILWTCLCDCGASVVVGGRNLRSGTTRSCGCLQREAATRSGQGNTRHGHAPTGHRSPEYRAWSAMLERCTNERHAAWNDYGGRGISVCERWRSFDAFLSDMGPRPSRQHTLDRVNNDGNYEPANCRWATWTQQARNRRGITKPNIEEVISMSKSGLSRMRIARATGLTPTTVERIVTGKHWMLRQ